MTIEIDHVSLSVGDYDKAKAFYVAALKPLRGGVVMEFPMDDGSKVMGLGSDGKPFLWVSGAGKVPHQHIALRAENREQVDAFYAAAIAAGGMDNGAPGLRPHYHQHYYAAYVLDPDGHNIEAVSQAPATKRRTASAKAAGKRASSAKKPAKRAAVKKPVRKPAARKAANKPAARKPAGRKSGRKTRR